MRPSRIVSCVFALSAYALPVLGQSAISDPRESSPYLLRLERTKVGKDVCVLLQGNGQYHLEEHTVNKTRIFEGTLGSEEIGNLKGLVSRDQLVNLRQTQIPDSLVIRGGLDIVLLAMTRGKEWQQLRFIDSSARVPFRESLDPLLKWLDAMQKQKVPELSDQQTPTDCQPATDAQFSGYDSTLDHRKAESKPDATPATAAARTGSAPLLSSKEGNYIFRMQEIKEVSGELLSTCVILYPSGAYHLVSEIHTRVEDRRSKILDGSVDRSALTSLREILGAPDLIAEPSAETPSDKAAGQVIVFKGEAFDMFLAIPRGGKTQKIHSWKTGRLSLYNYPALPGTSLEHGGKLLRPFRDWLKANVLKDKHAVQSSSAENTRCLPTE